MAVDNAPPLIVIGMEGLWGTIIMLIIFPIAAALPGRDLGSIENTADSFYMLSQSSTLQVLCFFFCFFVFCRDVDDDDGDAVAVAHAVV